MKSGVLKMPGGMRGWIAIAGAIAMVTTIFSTGCASSRRDALVARQVNVSNRQLEIGQRVFMAECNQCHPGGAAGLGPAINNKPIPGFVLRFQVRHGLGAMPKFDHSQISSQALTDLVLYVKTLRHEPMLVAHR
ncbi:MAG TPA: cytochrome c [Tepidisphaeraceae bacterium]|nr:cytochrome c [Tepidisphaeraceae bacterium]